MKSDELLLLGQSGIYVYNIQLQTFTLIRSGNYTSCGKDKYNYIALRADGNICTSKTGYIWKDCGLAHSDTLLSKIKCNAHLTYLGPFFSPAFTGYNGDDYCNWSRAFDGSVNINDVEWNGTTWLAGGDSLYTSPDGKVWKSPLLVDLGGGLPHHINTILWDTKQWILSGNGTGIFVVNESLTTSLRTMPPQGDGVFQGPLFFNFSAPTRYMAGQISTDANVALANPLITSENAMQWTACDLGVSNITQVCDITYENKTYYVVAKTTDGKTHLLSSVNGTQWTHVSNNVPTLNKFFV